jgi:hypothetical protein
MLGEGGDPIFSKEFYATRIQHLMQRLKECVDNEGDIVEK